MIRAARAVGNAAAEPFLRFGDDDAPIRAFAVQLEAEDGAAEAAADDDNGLGDGLGGVARGACGLSSMYRV
jgi:hypothetical protein